MNLLLTRAVFWMSAVCSRCRRGRIGFTTLGVAAVLGLPLSAQSQACRQADDRSEFLIGTLQRLSSSQSENDAYQRRDLKIPVVDTATIVLVTSQQTCNKVLTAFLANLPSNWPTPLPTNVYVVKVGTVFVAMHPTPPDSETLHVVLDSKYKLLAKYSH